MRLAFLTGVAGLVLAGGPALAQDLIFPPGEDDTFNWASYEEFAAEYDLTGQDLSLFGPWLTADQDLFESVIAYFEAATGADVSYAGSDSFEQQIVIDAQAGSAPNIGIFPQPGLVRDLAERGLVAPLEPETADWLRENYAAGESWVDLSTFAGPDGQEQLYGFFYKADLKSLVWYIPENFEDAGYEVPETMEELPELSEQIVADGGTPWCIGVGDGEATGWPATDWVEDLMLRLNPPEVYDQWVAHEIPFNDPQVVAAIEAFGTFVRNDDWVAGGSGAVATTNFRESPGGLFASPPECYMHRQASFIPSFFPEGVEIGVDADFFYFPPFVEEDLGSPVLGAGTIFAITEDSEAARVFIEFLKTPIAHEVWMAQTSFLTPLQSANVEAYVEDAQKQMAEILLGATTFRFDASDLMPGRIGAGAFWTGMVDFVGGESAEAVATEIENTWAALN